MVGVPLAGTLGRGGYGTLPVCGWGAWVLLNTFIHEL